MSSSHVAQAEAYAGSCCKECNNENIEPTDKSIFDYLKYIECLGV
ncbi:hypothetical protein [Morganella phage IME1369_01]|nr:hypothetical protein [Morganella phage IME1369_01]